MKKLKRKEKKSGATIISIARWRKVIRLAKKRLKMYLLSEV